jgi:ABC-type multidrug transport system fused ATPase/permease subunit
MLRLDWRLALLVFVFLPLPALIGVLAAPVQTQRERGLLDRWTRIYARFNEVLSGIVTVKSFAMEEEEKRRFLHDVDGANAIHEFFAVTLPGLRYELQVVLVLSLIDTLGTFDEIYVMTSGGPGTATSVPAYLVWRRMFQTAQVGSAAALGITLMLIIFAVTWVANRLMDRWGSDE